MSTMARFASQSLNYYQRSISISISINHFSTQILALHHHNRHMSSKTTTQVDSDESSSSSSEGDSISKAMTKLEETVQNFVIRRSAPDWLPFVPGASYWVPPPDPKYPCKGIIEIIDKVSKSRRRRRRRSSSELDETMLYSPPLHVHGTARSNHVLGSIVMLESSEEAMATDSDEEY